MTDPERIMFRMALLGIRLALDQIAHVVAEARGAIEKGILVLDRDAPQPPTGH